MKATPEQQAAMTARGWQQDEGGFAARSEVAPNYALALRVWWWRGKGWVADYGWSGVSFSNYRPHPDPMSAADDAEAWLRSVLAGFAFPWLRAAERTNPAPGVDRGGEGG